MLQTMIALLLPSSLTHATLVRIACGFSRQERCCAFTGILVDDTDPERHSLDVHRSTV